MMLSWARVVDEGRIVLIVREGPALVKQPQVFCFRQDTIGWGRNSATEGQKEA